MYRRRTSHRVRKTMKWQQQQQQQKTEKKTLKKYISVHCDGRINNGLFLNKRTNEAKRRVRMDENEQKMGKTATKQPNSQNRG